MPHIPSGSFLRISDSLTYSHVVIWLSYVVVVKSTAKKTNELCAATAGRFFLLIKTVIYTFCGVTVAVVYGNEQPCEN